MIERVFQGFVGEDGKFALDFPAQFYAYVGRKEFRGEEVEIEFRKRRAKRSDRQNRGFHACIAPWAHEEGHNVDDLKRDVLREVFGTREVTNAITGEIGHELAEPHTSRLDVHKFCFLMERTVEIAAGCGVLLQLPDEYKAAKLEVRRVVMARDKVCRVCKGTPYDVHHILPRSRGGRDVESNLIAVCRNCHTLIHGHVIKVSCRDEANRAGTVKFEQVTA